MIQTVDIIEALINDKLKLTLKVLADATVNGDGDVEVKVCNTQWIRPGKKVDFGGNAVKVIAFEFNKMLTLKGDAFIPVKGEYPINNPFYRHGTFRDVDGQLGLVEHSDDKYPLIFLYEEIDENIGLENEAIARESPLRLYFLDNTNTKDWDTDKHYDNIIYPQSNMVEAMIQLFKDEPSIAEFTAPAGYKNKVRFGVFTENGNERNILSDNLTGIEFRPTVRFFKSCEDLCKPPVNGGPVLINPTFTSMMLQGEDEIPFNVNTEGDVAEYLLYEDGIDSGENPIAQTGAGDYEFSYAFISGKEYTIVAKLTDDSLYSSENDGISEIAP